mmetsp:Transcript_30147/g.26712  ORF Transcript_30147/g.26712 Transcript_30147/m.26712 type:complete len:181 (-) Transcript_30147:173-715(-)
MVKLLKSHIQSNVNLPSKEENTRNVGRSFIKSSFSLRRQPIESYEESSVSSDRDSSIMEVGGQKLNNELDKSKEYIRSVNEILEEAHNTMEYEDTFEKSSKNDIEDIKEQMEESKEKIKKEGSSRKSVKIDFSFVLDKEIKETEHYIATKQIIEDRREHMNKSADIYKREEDLNTISVED